MGGLFIFHLLPVLQEVQLVRVRRKVYPLRVRCIESFHHVLQHRLFVAFVEDFSLRRIGRRVYLVVRTDLDSTPTTVLYFR